MVDYFRDMSHGTLDLSETQIFPTKEIGWFKLNASFKEFRKIVDDEVSRADAETEKTRIRLRGKIIWEKKVYPRNNIWREPLVNWAKKAANKIHPDWPKVDLSKFFGVVVVYNTGDVDLFGS